MKRKVNNLLNLLFSLLIPVSFVVLLIFYNTAVGKTDLVILSDLEYIAEHLKELLKNEYFMVGACIFLAIFFGVPACWINAISDMFLMEHATEERLRKHCIGMLVYNIIIALLLFASAGGAIYFGVKCETEYLIYAIGTTLLIVITEAYYFAFYGIKIKNIAKLEELKEKERVAEAQRLAEEARAEAIAKAIAMQRNIIFIVKPKDGMSVKTNVYFQNVDRTTESVETVYADGNTDLTGANKVYEDKYLEYYVKRKTE